MGSIALKKRNPGAGHDVKNRTGFLRNCHEHRIINKHNNNDSLVYKLLLTF